MTAAHSAHSPETGKGGVSLGVLVAGLIAIFALDNVLLLGFLGHPPQAVAALAIIVPVALGGIASRAVRSGGPAISRQTLLICFALAAVLLLLGGEGRLYYANEDWQIRDAVLRDMATHRWPFDYMLDGTSQMLRAPLGMYLLPALAGSARDWAMLAQNSFVLGLLLALGAALFDGKRARGIALVVFLAFSGLDVIGTTLVQLLTGTADWDHLERWGKAYQFSAHVTQIFWVPNHAFAGWACALFYLLWRADKLPIGLFAAIIPLVALWSPFALFGALPFALFAGARCLMTGRWVWRDAAFAGLALFLALPAFLYLRSDATAVGGGFRPPPTILYLLMILLEVLPFIWPLLRDRSTATDRPSLWIASVFLLIAPALAVGPHTDFQMRATIMPLAIVALGFAAWVAQQRTRLASIYALLLLGLASLTGLAELRRAFMLAPAPAPLCSLQKAWTQQTGLIVPHSTYFARRAALPPGLAPAPPADRAGTDDPPRCWERDWRTARR